MIRALIYVLSAITLFFLFHFEPINFGSLKFGILWKTLVFIVLIIYAISIFVKTKKINKLETYGFLFSIKVIFNLSSLTNIISTINNFLQTVSLYLFIYTFNYMFNKKQLLEAMKFLTIFVILSFFPYMFDLLKSLGRSVDMTAYGGNGMGLIGAFQNPHSASITLAFSIVILTFQYLETKKKYIKILVLIILLIGIYELLQTYVRTGLVLVVIAYFYMFVWKKRFIQYVKLLPLSFIIFMIVYSIYLNDQTWQYRLADKTIYNDDAVLGSGRLMFMYYALGNWLDGGVLSWIIGLGLEGAKDAMYLDIGARLFAHNGYIQILQAEGFLGIIIFIMVIFHYYKYIVKFHESSYYNINMTLLIMYLTQMMLQGGNYLMVYLYMASFMTIMKKSLKE